MYREIILSKLLKYLELKKWKIKKSGKVIMFLCPQCKKEPLSATILPNSSNINCYICKPKEKLGRYYNLLDVAKLLEEKFPEKEEDQLQYLKELLKIDVKTSKDEQEIMKVLEFYEKNGFDLVPVAKNAKNPIEKDWVNKSHKNKDEWFNWISNDLNIGVKTGIKSNITVIDIDQKPIPEEIRLMVGNTLIQETKKGFHLFYKYDKDFPKTRIEEFKIDIENDGGQVVLYPSIVENEKRQFISGDKIIEMPKDLKGLLKSKILMPSKTSSEKLREDIETENFKINPEDFKLKNDNLNGCCNSSFIKLGGILRKNLNLQETEFVLRVLNNHLLEKPMTYQAIKGMVKELDKYIQIDEEELALKVLEYLKIVDSPRSVNDISNTIMGTNRGEDKKRIEKVLNYLLNEEKIIKKGRASYEIVKEMNWTDTLIDVGSPVDFKIPYFYDYAYFNKKDLIIIGSKNQYGKTHLAMNIVKRLVTQGIKPYYIFNESGGRYGKVALKLGMKEGDFWRVYCGDPEKVILKNKAITIYDWVRPMGDEYAKTAEVFNRFIEQLEKTQGFMICFVQLKKDDSFFAPNMIGQFPALLVKYLHRNENGTETTFEVCKIRDSKIRKKHFNIDCIYDWQSREVKRLDELNKDK